MWFVIHYTFALENNFPLVLLLKTPFIIVINTKNFHTLGWILLDAGSCSID